MTKYLSRRVLFLLDFTQSNATIKMVMYFMMYKLIIVDDERKTLDILKRCIDWEKYGFELAELFFEADSAYNYICTNSVDIVICDIYMPSTSGLELLKKISNHAKPPMFIVLSAFREFEYAQEALRLGAFDYITKPITEEKFSVALSRAKNSLDKIILQPERNLSAKHMLVESLLSKTISDKNAIANMISNSDLIIEDMCCPAILIRASVADYQKYYTDNPQIYTPQQFQNSIYNLFEMIHPNIVIYNYSYNFIYFAIISPYKNYNEFIGFIKEKIGEIFNTLIEILNTEFVFDIYNMMADIFDVSQQLIELTPSITSQITECMLEKKYYELNDIFDSFVKKKKKSLDSYRFLYFCFLVILDTKLGLPFERFNPREMFLCKDTQEIYKSITGLIDLCTIKNTDSEAKDTSVIVVDAKEFIETHFKENINMTIIAKKVHVSVSYLSRLFKQESGQSIVHYIKDVRLKHAKKLLLTTDDSVESIAFASGYRSRNLFNSDFKEKYGQSPRNFKNNMAKEMEKFET